MGQRIGNKKFSRGLDPGKGGHKVPKTHLFELRARQQARIYYRIRNNKIEIVGISDKNNQYDVIGRL